jgi:hypothetical protein
MAPKWYVRRGKQTRGPISARELLALAAGGKLRADDRVWRDGVKPERAVPASRVPGFRAPGAALPDWLGDVQALEQLGPEPPPPLPPGEGVPDWIEDLRKVAADAAAAGVLDGSDLEEVQSPRAKPVVRGPANKKRRRRGG